MQIIQREKIVDIVGRRNEALEYYRESLELQKRAAELATKACQVGRLPIWSPFNGGKWSKCLNPKPPEEGALERARKRVDHGIWEQLIEMTELARYMDKKAKEELRAELSEDPPEISVENVEQTLLGFMSRIEETWRRGIAGAFSALDSRFKTHDGWKVGSRIILDLALSDFGYGWCYYKKHDDTLLDVERVFYVLDGKVQPNYCVAAAGVKSALESGESVSETEYFRIRTFANRNVHIWFKRKDLVEKVNQLLGEHYGAVLRGSRDASDDWSPKSPARSRKIDFFPTPGAVVERMWDYANIAHWKFSGKKVLEPSAGEGAIASAIVGFDVTCVELNRERADRLEEKGFEVKRMDFLKLPAKPDYDAVLMNPPFSGDQDTDHVRHAFEFLKPGGRLVSVMGASAVYGSGKRQVSFQKWMKKYGRMYDLPLGSFRECGTWVNTVIVVLTKPMA